MDGIYLQKNNGHKIRPAYKANVIATVKQYPERVWIEVTTWGEEKTLWLPEAPEGTYHFVGPDPHTDRRFYGMIKIYTRGGERKVSIR